MQLTIDFNRKLLAITGISILVGGALLTVAYFVVSAQQRRKAEEGQARIEAKRATEWAIEKKKEQYISDHRFDSLIKEQQWIMSHPDDPRLKGAPHGNQLEQFLNGIYSDVSSPELKAFTGRDIDYSLSDLDSDAKSTDKLTSESSTAEQMLAEGSLPDLPSKPLDARHTEATGLVAYYLVPENKDLMKALVNVAGGEVDAKKVAHTLGYTYSFKQEDARRNVLRAIRFANIFSHYSEILSIYARTGGSPALISPEDLAAYEATGRYTQQQLEAEGK